MRTRPAELWRGTREKLRSLTIEEMALLQGFLSDYIFTGDRTRQIGNAVPPPLSKTLGETILKEIGK